MKKLLFLLLTAALLLSMAGCSLGGKTLYLPEKIEIYYGDEKSQTMTFQYNEDGFLTEVVTDNGEQSHSTAITCDENGNVLSVAATAPSAASASKQYTYSTRGNLLSETSTINEQLQQQTQWEYNTGNQVIRAVHKTNAGNPVEYLYEYDDDGKLLAIRGYLEGEQVSETAFEYDEKGRMLRETLCNDRGIELSRAEYSYEDGKTVVVLTTNRTGTPMTVTYAFDHAGNLIEEAHGEGSNGYGIRYVYTYKEVKVSKDSPRRGYTGLQSLPAAGLTTLWP